MRVTIEKEPAPVEYEFDLKMCRAIVLSVRNVATPMCVLGAASGGGGMNSLLGDIFGTGVSSHTGYVPAKQVWLSAQKGKGLEVTGSWSR